MQSCWRLSLNLGYPSQNCICNSRHARIIAISPNSYTNQHISELFFFPSAQEMLELPGQQLCSKGQEPGCAGLGFWSERRVSAKGSQVPVEWWCWFTWVDLYTWKSNEPWNYNQLHSFHPIRPRSTTREIEIQRHRGKNSMWLRLSTAKQAYQF